MDNRGSATTGTDLKLVHRRAMLEEKLYRGADEPILYLPIRCGLTLSLVNLTNPCLRSPQVVRKSLSGFQTGEEVPPRSEPYLSEVVFCRSPRDFAKIPIVQDPTSPILTCSQCQLVVHARCYGCEDESAPGNDAGQSSSWMCDPCSAGTLDPVNFACLSHTVDSCFIPLGHVKKL